MRIGVDIGGTFTDIVVEGDGKRRSWKTSSTPPDFAAGLLAGVDLAAEELETDRRTLLAATEQFIHGTTVTTNVVLTRTGQRVGLITTRGFGDTYVLARQYRGQEQDPAKTRHPVPLVDPKDIVEVTERIDYSGRVVAPLNEQELEDVVRELASSGVNTFAVCFLWSFVNSTHESRAKEIILDLVPDAYISTSFEACPIIGEYERSSTSVINAYAGPSLRRYAHGLDQQLREEQLESPLLLMKSDGGLASVSSAVAGAAQTVYSGPAAGVVASKRLGEQLGMENLITFDMGGTSTDVALVYGGEIRTTSTQQVADQPLALPMIDVTSVGAGGGSLGAVALDGSLRVGPESAGAEPGPACYDRGGAHPAVTDANVALGLVDPSYFLGGNAQLDKGLAEEAIAQLSIPLSLDVIATAFGMFRVVNSVMADAIRLRTVFAGLDPREFTLVSFGGAGGLHCAAVAAELGITRIVVPQNASTFSAVGLVNSDLVYSFARSANIPVQAEGWISQDALEEINAIFRELDGRAVAELQQHDIAPTARSLQHTVEMSYQGQVLDFQVDAPMGELSEQGVHDLVKSFDEQYANVYGPGAAAPEHGYVIKSFKTVGIGQVGSGELGGSGAPAPSSTPNPKSTRTALADVQTGERREVDVYDASQLLPGVQLSGPAILEHPDTTVLVPVSFTVRVDETQNLVVEKSAQTFVAE